ncbi:MAG: hypothetical protein ABJB76_07965 [Candidatus Nitrosocosmicus sp.]
MKGWAVLGIGGLGHLAIRYSKAAVFHTTTIIHSKDKEELAMKLGADSVVNNDIYYNRMYFIYS